MGPINVPAGPAEDRLTIDTSDLGTVDHGPQCAEQWCQTPWWNFVVPDGMGVTLTETANDPDIHPFIGWKINGLSAGKDPTIHFVMDRPIVHVVAAYSN